MLTVSKSKFDVKIQFVFYYFVIFFHRISHQNFCEIFVIFLLSRCIMCKKNFKWLNVVLTSLKVKYKAVLSINYIVLNKIN